MYEWQVYAVFHKDLSVEGIAMAKGRRVSGKHQRVSSESSGAAGDHLAGRGSPGESIYENLQLVFLAKSFNPNRREFRVPE